MTLGPFSFSGGLLTTFAALIAMMIAGDRAGRARGLDIERNCWILIGAALLAARVAYVARYADLYLASPLGVLDIRDGGFSLAAGLSAGVMGTLIMAWRDRRRRTPMLLAGGAGAAVFALSAVAGLVWPQDSSRLPQLSLAKVDGGTLVFGELAGKPVVLNLWASWCGPCRREMPVLRQAQIDHPEMTFVFANQGETVTAVRDYLAAQHTVLDNVVLDTGSNMGVMLNSSALPTTFFFDKNGVMVARRMGEVSAATLAEQLASLHSAHSKQK